MYGVMGGNVRILEEMLASMTPDERAVIGFPRVDSDYWNAQTVEAVRRRFQIFGMDVSPYREAAAKRKGLVSKL